MLKKTASSPQSAFYLHSDRWRSPPPPFIPELSVAGGECFRNQSFYANSLAARDETKPMRFLMSFFFSLVVFAFLTLSETWNRTFDCVTRPRTVQTQVPAGWFISRRATNSSRRLFYLYSCGSGRGSWPRIAHFTVDVCPVALVCLYILSFYDSEGTCVPAMEACTGVN